MITPVDIRNKVFNREVRGYSKQEVDEFLNDVMSSYEKLYTDNIAARDKITALEESVGQYRSTADALQSALLVAHNVSEEIRQKAKAEADALLASANAEVARVKGEADEYARNTMHNYKTIHDYVERFKDALRLVYTTQRHILEYSKETNKSLDDLFAMLDNTSEVEQPQPIATATESKRSQPAAEPKHAKQSSVEPKRPVFTPEPALAPEPTFEPVSESEFEFEAPPAESAASPRDDIDVPKPLPDDEDGIDIKQLLLNIRKKHGADLDETRPIRKVVN